MRRSTVVHFARHLRRRLRGDACSWRCNEMHTYERGCALRLGRRR